MENEKKHILMIDDDPAIQRVFGAKLSGVGFEMLYANDVEAGREMARRLLPDLILLDVRMSGAGGIELARRMKQEDRTKNIPIILLTNEDLAIEAEKWMKDIGVSDYIHKSIDLNEFIARIKKVVKWEVVS